MLSLQMLQTMVGLNLNLSVTNVFLTDSAIRTAALLPPNLLTSPKGRTAWAGGIYRDTGVSFSFLANKSRPMHVIHFNRRF